MKSIWFVLALLCLLLAIPASAQEATAEPSLEELVGLMSIPKEDGIAESFTADTRFKAASLSISEVKIPLLGIDVEITGVVRPETENYYDQQVEVTGQTGPFPKYEDRAILWMDVSVLSALDKYQQRTERITLTDAVLSTVFKPVPTVNYKAVLALDHLVVSQTRVSLPAGDTSIRLTNLLWIQFRDTEDPLELSDESTWHGLLLLETDQADYILLPNWDAVILEVECGPDVKGDYRQGVLYCGEERAEDFLNVGINQRYGGIYY